MARDIEEFLRKAAERRNQQKNQAGGARSPSQPPSETQHRRQPNAPKPSQQRPPRANSDDDIVAAEVISVGQESVAAHVQRHMDNHEISDHAKQLGYQLGQTDENLAARLHESFDHQVGSLQHTHDPYSSTKKDVRHDLLKLLRDPESIREAIVVAEILKRPDFKF